MDDMKRRIGKVLRDVAEAPGNSGQGLIIHVHQNKFARVTRKQGRNYGSQKEDSLKGVVYLKRRIGGLCGRNQRTREEILEIFNESGLVESAEEGNEMFEDMLWENGGGARYARQGIGFRVFALQEIGENRYKVYNY